MILMIKFEDDEYMTLAEGLYEIGIEIPLTGGECNEYPIKYEINSKERAVYIDIANPNLAKDIIKELINLADTYLDINSLSIKEKYSRYFETCTIDFVV